METGGRSARRIVPVAALLVGAFFLGIFAASRLSSEVLRKTSHGHSALRTTSDGRSSIAFGRMKLCITASMLIVPSVSLVPTLSHQSTQCFSEGATR